LFKKITIIGVGLIGGSLGMAIKKHKLARQVVGFSQKHSSLVTAMQSKAIDVASHDLRKALHNADLVILSTPVNTIINLLPKISRYLRRGCIVTDVGSTKTLIVEAAEKHLPGGFFIGSHPLAGSEKKGAGFASAELFDNSVCILTPTDKVNRGAKEKVQTFWTRLGTTVKVLSPEEHDKILAYISHLPHLLAYGLMGSIPPGYLEFAATGLKDTTRIASSSPQMWNDICLANAKPLLGAVDELVKNLAVLRKAISNREEKTLTEYFQKSKEKRDGIL